MMSGYSFVLFLWVSLFPGPVADPAHYLDEIKTELTKQWPDNRTINLVFHGHSVPAGYFKTPVVNTLEAYPYQLLKQIKARYPYAVVNVINTSIGGEHSQSGEKRFVSEVLPHRPDVLFIDYALNDRRIGLADARKAWESMINEALKRNIKVILLTPSPDQRVDLLESGNELEQHALQIEQMAATHGIGLVDSYSLFRQQIQHGENVVDFMSQVNHPNEKGHALIADALMAYFR
ncbi:SGNH/GDSL hydrolase family protein [Salmonirosea aquatica]|uniref:SGNH/GDSL hydrolase family protein n=1 Tax=Salmonirosea aquatica TaxID=2654236 RepID=A0A7C9FEH9_9BACT|nr:SGNH/GDSL hydrolase family protein [Cytophagaceae bacterium SJW1-29]